MSAARAMDVSGLSQHRLALLGNPNCGKSTLFNRLTGSQQKVANYAGVTVELKRGLMRTASGRNLTLVDLPGTYSLHADSEDEAVACQVILGQSLQEKAPDLILVVIDITRLRRGLRLVSSVRRLGIAHMVVLSMMDREGELPVRMDAQALEAVLGVPVVATSSNQSSGLHDLRERLDDASLWARPVSASRTPVVVDQATSLSDDQQAQAWLLQAGIDAPPDRHPWSERLDAGLLHPLLGPLVLLAVLFLVFQAVFSWAAPPMEAIKSAVTWLSDGVRNQWSPGVLQSLVADGILAGVGSVLVFLPQILILFFFILVLEESGYLPRAALLLDRLMASVGLSGRSFIPLLSSFACAVPGVMAARTIANRRDRWLTMAIAPLMTCSARLPVYALLIAAFIPDRSVAGMNLQGLVLFGLYGLGIVSALMVAACMRWIQSGEGGGQLMMELPDYHWPRWQDVAIGLWQRARIFLRNVGGIILALTIVLWFLSSFPAAPAGFQGAAIEYSLAGRIGKALAHVFEPIGFNWQIAVALIPGLAAREVAVGALGTVYALSATGDEVGQALAQVIATEWSLATGLSLLIWYVYAPQCLATLATVRRESGGWQLPLIMVVYLFGLAYLASWLTYHLAKGWGA